ncbi:MAG TPA: error-prone DNA polymerase, partial [Acidimicrobiales bacterium]
VAEGVRLGLSAMALTDHDGLYGVVRFAEVARALEMPTVFGAELTLAPAAVRTGEPDPAGHHLIVLARDPDGYRRLSVAIADAHLAGGEKGRPVFGLDELAERHGGHWQILTGCRKGAVPQAMDEHGPAAARTELRRLVERFGAANVAAELWHHDVPVDWARNDGLARLAVEEGVDFVATNNVHYHRSDRFPLATTLAAVRARRSLDDLEGWLPAGPGAVLRSPAEQARRFARWPGAVETAGAIGDACAFDLHLIAPRLPDFPVPVEHTEQSWLVELVRQGATRRYGPRERPRVAGAWERLDHELAVIGSLGFAGYFLTVWDLTEFCRRQNIFCQGRGSAATSAVCFALGITNVDAVSLNLLFERFLSPARDGPPDIDVDFESGRREEVIQYVYEHYGRRRAAQVANVICYRPRSAIRDVGKALGHDVEVVDGWAKATDRRHTIDQGGELPPLVEQLATEVLDFPRHLGIHSGGMVICDRPVIEVCPVEWARMPGRTVLEWDKDDCAAAGLVKFDLLGLGMLEALHHMVTLIAESFGRHIDLGQLPQEDAVYDLLGRADTVGVFQVESRAQMGTLPRVRPRTFYDLAIEVALIRPGPIQGNAVHPYIRRRRGEEEVTYLHPLLEPALKRTLGVPLFQEQLMEIAIAVAGFSPTEADELRQAMSAKRSVQRMERLRHRLFAGMAAKGVSDEVATQVYDALRAFASFGFPESHSIAFAGLVYSTAWMKVHYPAAFTAGLLNAQPMGFWSPQSLVADAKRHGVDVRRPDVQRSRAGAALEEDGQAVRLGLGSVRGLGDDVAERIASGQPWASMEDLVRRAGVDRAQLEALATAGALRFLDDNPTDDGRRAQLWRAGAAAQGTPDRLPGVVTGMEVPALPEPSALEDVADDLWSMGVTPDRTAIELIRPDLKARGVVPAADISAESTARRVTVAGVVTHRQQPESAKGAVFLNLEDETGMVNIIFSKGAWVRWRSVARLSPVLVIRGSLERQHGAVAVVAERVEALALDAVPGSRDFR